MRTDRAATALLATVLMICAPATVSAAAGPDPELLFRLQERNERRPWLRVTTDSARFQLQARHLDELGLTGLKARSGEPLPREPLAWAEIRRVDEIVTRSRDYASIGGIALGALGAWLGWGLGAPTDDGQVWGIVGFASGAAVGAWAGSAYGKGFQSEENWYRAPTPPPAPPMDTAQKATAVADSPDELSPASLELAADIGPNDKLRVIGGFGRFQGYAHGAGPGGLDRLVADRDAPDDWNADALPPQIPWSAIDEVQMRRGSGGRGAVIGAVTFGLLGGLLAYGANSALGGDVSTKDAVVIGGTFSALVGAALGAGVGAASRHWEVVYRRP